MTRRHGRNGRCRRFSEWLSGCDALSENTSGAPAVIEHSVWIEKVVTIASEQTGMFYPLVKRGTYVEQGMKVGYVTDYLGKVIFETRAPVAGVVLYVCAVPSMTKAATTPA